MRTLGVVIVDCCKESKKRCLWVVHGASIMRRIESHVGRPAPTATRSGRAASRGAWRRRPPAPGDGRGGAVGETVGSVHRAPFGQSNVPKGAVARGSWGHEGAHHPGPAVPDAERARPAVLATPSPMSCLRDAIRPGQEKAAGREPQRSSDTARLLLLFGSAPPSSSSNYSGRAKAVSCVYFAAPKANNPNKPLQLHGVALQTGSGM
jgi:hypothetical protein